MSIRLTPNVTDPALDPESDGGLAGTPARAGVDPLRRFLRRLVQGELGNLPVILGLAAVWTYFQLENDRFLSSGNLTNLMLQIAGMGTIAIGVVLVLLLGEIDLSVAWVSGLSAGVMAVLNVKSEWDPVLAMGAGLAVGMGIGLLQGLWVTKLQVPSFVVTLAGFLAWQGALLRVLGTTGTVNINDETIRNLTFTYFSDREGWMLAACVIAVTTGVTAVRRARTRSAGLQPPAAWEDLLRLGVIAAITVGAVAVFNDDRGVPLAVCIFVGLVVLVDLVTRRTVFGRHIFAVGGNAEAARRAGIRVDRIRIAVFVLASTLAATGGMLLASRLQAVNRTSGAGDLLLMSIAAAVIGGTSLFGGRGSAWSALLGALVIGSVDNGMDLLGQTSEVKFMVTGAVLLVAATVDAVSRRGRQAAGRA